MATILDDLLRTRLNQKDFYKLMDDLTDLPDVRKTPLKIKINNKNYEVQGNRYSPVLADELGNSIALGDAIGILYRMPLIKTSTGFRLYDNLDELVASQKKILIEKGVNQKLADEVASQVVDQMAQKNAFIHSKRISALEKGPLRHYYKNSDYILRNRYVVEDANGAVIELETIFDNKNYINNTRFFDNVRKTEWEKLKVPDEVVGPNVGTIKMEDLMNAVKSSPNALRYRLQSLFGKFGVPVTITTAAILGILAGTGNLSSSAAGNEGTAASAASAASASGLTEAEIQDRYRRFMQVFLARLAMENQKEMNGCFLYNSLSGDMTRVALLSCGKVDPESLKNAMNTCPTQNFTPGATVTRCASDTFNPCLKAASSRTTDASISMVPDVCNQYLYNGTRPTNVPAGVTVTDACADQTNATSGTCSSFCKTEQFNLPSFMELVCVKRDLTTAYADMMQQMGYKVEQYLPPVPPSGRSSRMKWVIAGVVGLLLLAIAGAWYRRRNVQHVV